MTFRLALLVLALLLLNGCASLFFFPEREHRLDPADHDIAYEDVTFTSGDGLRLHGWWLPARTGEEPLGTVLFLHGNAQNVSTHIAAVYWLPAEGFNVFLFDYRGFGRSEGQPDFAGVHRDSEAALRKTLGRPEVEAGSVVVFGQSLGASVAITLTAEIGHELEVRGLVADSPFSSYRGIAREKFAGFWLTWPLQWPLSWTISDRFAPVEFVHKVSPIPLLLMAGERDTIVPPHHAQLLYETAEPPVELRMASTAGHTQSLLVEGEREYLVRWMTEQLER
ncbi:MAG: alpha/beta hydrolase [Ectothiorhodospiraceae bacterium]|nr:alpha/beta hydrolase [Ectothiorhodospiraceae bacterium]MCH8503016.1 alpha/beta hydrolase [Ectothiorhodospiraceae bacterium]